MVMDIEKEREAFEKFFYENCLVQWEKDMHEMLFQKLESGDYEYVRLQSSWLSWQESRVRAVPKGFVLIEREKLAMILETATNALVYHEAPPKHSALSIIQGIARKAMIESKEQNQ